MKYVYASRSGHTEKLVHALGLDAIKLSDTTPAIGEDFIIFTYTDGKGVVPKLVERFLKANGSNLKGVVVTGDKKHHAATFCWAGDIIAKEYNVPCLAKIDGEGTAEDREALRKELSL